MKTGNHNDDSEQSCDPLGPEQRKRFALQMRSIAELLEGDDSELKLWAYPFARHPMPVARYEDTQKTAVVFQRRGREFVVQWWSELIGDPTESTNSESQAPSSASP